MAVLEAGLQRFRAQFLFEDTTIQESSCALPPLLRPPCLVNTQSLAVSQLFILAHHISHQPIARFIYTAPSDTAEAPEIGCPLLIGPL